MKRCLNQIYLFGIAFLLSVYSTAFSFEYTLSVAAIFQNEGPYLKEWIEFHRLAGVEHFYLYNNASTDEYDEVLEPYIEEGIVEFFDWPDLWPTIRFDHGAQIKAYEDCLQRARGVTKWLTFIDIDEFLFPSERKNIASLLEEEYSDYAAITVNWQMYGTSCISKISPKKLMIEQLIMKAPENFYLNYYFKSIVRPEFVVGCTFAAHSFVLESGFSQIYTNKTAHKKLVRGEEVHIDKMRINHYWTRDEKTLYELKIPRFLISRKGGEGGVTGFLERARPMNTMEDRVIFKYVKELRKNMGLDQ